MGQRILITGISRHLAARLAGRLEADPEVEYIAGVDLEEPELDLERTEYIRGDIRNPLIVKTLQGSGVDTVVHLRINQAFREGRQSVCSREIACSASST